MEKRITRRRALGWVAGTAASLTTSDWIFALNPQGRVVKTAAGKDAVWRPHALDPEQAEALARLCDAILPRTDTPGARDARVHEYIDLVLAVGPQEERQEFMAGLGWLGERCLKLLGKTLAQANGDELGALLRSVSDENETHAQELEAGAAFFVDLKRRTIFGYYTSREGRVEELGLPEAVTMETLRGCPHGGGTHA